MTSTEETTALIVEYAAVLRAYRTAQTLRACPETTTQAETLRQRLDAINAAILDRQKVPALATKTDDLPMAF